MTDILIHGRGLAALTAAWLLCEKGFCPVICGAASKSTRRIALNSSTVELIETLFGVRVAENESVRAIHRRRAVGWDDSQDMSVPWLSLAIDSNSLTADIDQQLLRRFGDQVSCPTTPPSVQYQLVIDTIGPHHPQYRSECERLTFGRRVSTVCTLRAARPLDEVLAERTAAGWLFLLPSAMDLWTLYLVTASPDSEPEKSIVNAIECSSLKGKVSERTQAEAWFPAAPILHHPLVTQNLIRAGEAAFTFDPLCGDGVGFAIRSGVLASTVAADVVRQERRGLNYYQLRLNRAFCAHLEACCQYYSQWTTPEWQREVATMHQGIKFLEPIRSVGASTQSEGQT